MQTEHAAADEASDDNNIQGDDALTELSFQQDDESTEEAEGQALRELAFAISKNRAKNEGVVHRGVTCDKCGRSPIVGVRYRCSNCQDYDLCEDCEARDEHPPTHVFYRVKVPAHWAGKMPLPLWYPGRPSLMPAELDARVRLKLHKEMGYTENQIDGMYQQFRCIAGVRMDEQGQDPLGLGVAIDRAAFDQCFVPETRSRAFKKANLVLERLFKFYDRNGDSLIDFREFVGGIMVSREQGTRSQTKARRVFEALDLDDDGRLSRTDCLKFFKAFFELNKEFTLLLLDSEARAVENVNHDTQETARDAISGGRPLASFFTEGRLDFDAFVDSASSASSTEDPPPPPPPFFRDANLLSDEEIITDTWHTAEDLLDRDIKLRAFKSLKTEYLDGDLLLIRHLPAGVHKTIFKNGGGGGGGGGDDATLWVHYQDEEYLWEDGSSGRWQKQVAYLRYPNPNPAAPHPEDMHASVAAMRGEAKRVALESVARRREELRRERLEVRAKYKGFYVDVDGGDGGGGDQDGKSKIRSPPPTLNEHDYDYDYDYAYDHNEKEEEEVGAVSDHHYSSYHRSSPVGGSEVAQNIYAVTEQAINEVLDSLFRPAETRVLERRARRMRPWEGGGGSSEQSHARRRAAAAAAGDGDDDDIGALEADVDVDVSAGNEAKVKVKAEEDAGEEDAEADAEEEADADAAILYDAEEEAEAAMPREEAAMPRKAEEAEEEEDDDGSIDFFEFQRAFEGGGAGGAGGVGGQIRGKRMLAWVGHWLDLVRF